MTDFVEVFDIVYITQKSNLPGTVFILSFFFFLLNVMKWAEEMLLNC